MNLVERARANYWPKRLERFWPTKQDRTVRRFYEDGGETKLRYDYPLNADSVVLDLGGYHGDWSAKIYELYRPTIYIAEPVSAFAEIIRQRFAGLPKIHVVQGALGGTNRTAMISLRDFDSSSFRPSDLSEPMRVYEINSWLVDRNVGQIDLIKINIEGDEYELLEHMLFLNMHKRCANIQVQFHDLFPDAQKRMKAIGRQLQETHDLTYDYEFVWQNWRRR